MHAAPALTLVVRRYSNITQTQAKPLAEEQSFQMLASSWLTGGVKSGAYARPAPYAQGSIIPGSNYSAQDNHASLKVSGM